MGFTYAHLRNRAAAAGGEEAVEELDDLLGFNVIELEPEEDIRVASITDIQRWVEGANSRFGSGA